MFFRTLPVSTTHHQQQQLTTPPPPAGDSKGSWVSQQYVCGTRCTADDYSALDHAAMSSKFKKKASQPSNALRLLSLPREIRQKILLYTYDPDIHIEFPRDITKWPLTLSSNSVARMNWISWTRAFKLVCIWSRTLEQIDPLITNDMIFVHKSCKDTVQQAWDDAIMILTPDMEEVQKLFKRGFYKTTKPEVTAAYDKLHVQHNWSSVGCDVLRNLIRDLRSEQSISDEELRIELSWMSSKLRELLKKSFTMTMDFKTHGLIYW